MKRPPNLMKKILLNFLIVKIEKDIFILYIFIDMIQFKHLVIFTSLLISGCAAYFSVYGIGLLFSGATIAVMIMASSL